MLPTSHQAPTIRTASPVLPRSASDDAAMVLAEVSSGFLAASTRLSDQYRDLRRQVGQLGRELAVRDTALEASRRDNEAWRFALHAVVDAMPCGVLILGPGGCVVQANPEACRLLDCSEVELMPSTDALPEQLAHALSALRGNDGVQEIRMPAVNSSELERRLQLCAHRFSAKPGGLETILILSDVSARKADEQERGSVCDAAAMAELAATLAHEMRNPLAGLEMFAELIEEQPERCREWLGHLRAGLRGMAASLNNVLSFYGAGCPLPQTVALGRVLASAAEFARPVVEQAGLHLVVKGESLPGTVAANETALQQVVLNLVVNAARHTPAGSTLTLALEQPCRTHLQLRVSDTGSGITPEDMPHISKDCRPVWRKD